MAGKVIEINSVDREPAARVEGDELVLEGFVERDPHVVALVRESEDPDALVHDIMVVGGRAMSAARVTTETAVVEKAFDDMTITFSQGLDAFTGELETRTRELLDGEDGALPRSFEEFRSELEQLLEGTFDPDSKRSALAKLEEVMREAAAEQVKAV